MELHQQLDNAIMDRDEQRVRDLLQPNNINLLAPENSHLLWLAITRKNIAIIELLIRAGANLAAEDPFDESASILHELLAKATLEDDARLVEDYERLALLAIEHGADVNARDDEDRSVFQLAVQSPRQSAILMRAMLERGARVQDDDDFDQMLEEATEGRAAAEAVPMLIGLNDPSDEVRSQRAVSAIVAMLQVPEVEFDFRAFEGLLSMVVDVNQPGFHGETMLVAAAQRGILSVVATLLNRGADVNRKAARGELPLYAASQSSNSAVTKLLISYGADIHARNDDGAYPIHGACASVTVDNLHFLLSFGASLNVTDHSGKYPIHIAGLNTCREIMHLLLSIDTPINVIDFNGKSPFPLQNWVDLHPTNSLFIRRYAFLHVTSGAVCEKDLAIIRANPNFSRFFDTCLNELRIMSETVVFEHFNMLSLLAANTYKLSAYLRNADFSAAIKNSIQQHRHRFPTYSKQFLMPLKLADKNRNVAQHMNDVLDRSFPVAIPSLAIQKITDYALFEELFRSKLNFYLALYQRINGRDLDFFSNV